jgi:tRNA(Ser,Leu) C12 N-acetylase TAN1
MSAHTAARIGPDDSNLLVSFPWPMPGRARRAVVARLRTLGDRAPVARPALSKGVLAARTTLEPHAAVRELRALYRHDPEALRNTSRWVPVDRWTAPDVDAMTEAVRGLRDRIGVHDTWRMTVERRPGNALRPEAVIQALALLVEAKVDLAHPDKILLIELFADRVALAVVTPAEILSVATPGHPRPADEPARPAEPPTGVSHVAAPDAPRDVEGAGHPP